LPASGISAGGAIDLGGDGTVAVAAASTINFALRTLAEQQAVVGAFGRWLNSLQGSAQILVRAHRLDLSAMVAGLEDNAAGLPHPALESAALDHAAFLAGLAVQRDLLARQVLLVVHEPVAATAGRGGPRGHAHSADRVRRRIEDTARMLAAADLAVTVLDGPQAAAVLAACCGVDQQPPGSGTAGPGQVIVSDGLGVPGPGDASWPGE